VQIHDSRGLTGGNHLQGRRKNKGGQFRLLKKKHLDRKHSRGGIRKGESGGWRRQSTYLLQKGGPLRNQTKKDLVLRRKPDSATDTRWEGEGEQPKAREGIQGNSFQTHEGRNADNEKNPLDSTGKETVAKKKGERQEERRAQEMRRSRDKNQKSDSDPGTKKKQTPGRMEFKGP